MAKATTLFVVEGARREIRFLKSMQQECMPESREVEILVLPAEQDIYMLYQKLAEDEFETDIVEVLRESSEKAKKALAELRRSDIDEIFLFFDFDPQRFKRIGVGGALPQIATTMEKMLNAFNNETEFGKLYVSYPMIEALYDYKKKEPLCAAYSSCYIPFRQIADYKSLAGSGNPIASRHEVPWQEILNVFVARVSCLLDLDDLDFLGYRNTVTPLSIYHMQRQVMKEIEMVFGLSSLPEFLLDYYTEDFWRRNIRIEGAMHEGCKNRAVLEADSAS